MLPHMSATKAAVEMKRGPRSRQWQSLFNTPHLTPYFYTVATANKGTVEAHWSPNILYPTSCRFLRQRSLFIWTRKGSSYSRK